jgi:transposase
METVLTYQYRIKDSTVKKTLISMAASVNFVWNFSNDIVRRRWKESRFFTYDSTLNLLTKGSSKELPINSQTIQATFQELLKQVKKNKKQIRFRSRKNKLGWIPFNGQTFKFLGNYSIYNGHKIRYWFHRPLPEGAVIKTGTFCEDSLGNWFLNLTVSFPEYLTPSKTEEDVGVDLGIKTIAALSTGEKETRDNISKQFEKKLARAQRHKKKRQERKIHLKIKNKRKDWNHKHSFKLAENYRRIFVGDTSSNSILTEIPKINRAVYDAGWYALKQLLSYKVLRRQGVYLEVPEQKSNEICSFCLKEKTEKLTLDIREWICNNCNTLLDRDINAARNHLRFGSESLSS